MKLFGYNLRLRQQLIVYFIIFALIPASVITILARTSNMDSLNTAKNELDNLQGQKLSGLANQFATNVENWVYQESYLVGVIARDSSLRTYIQDFTNNGSLNPSLNKIDQLFANWVDSSPKIYEMILLNYSSGTVILSYAGQGKTNTTNNKSSDSYFSGAKSEEGTSIINDKTYFKDVYYSNTAKSYMMAFSQVVRPMNSSTGNPVGILVVRFDPNSLWNELAPRINNQPVNQYYINLGLGKTGEVYLINSNGLAISRSRFDTTDSNFILKQDFSSINGFQTALKNGIKNGTDINYLQNKVFSVYLYLGSNTSSIDLRGSIINSLNRFYLPWVLVVEINQQEVLTPVTSLENQQTSFVIFNISIIIIVGILVTLLSLYISNSISKPIIKLSTISQIMASGDLTTEIEKTNKDDEIGDLERSFREMTNFLKPSIISIRNITNILSTSSQEMASSSEEVNASSEELSSVAQQISKGAQQQSEYLDRSSKQVEEIRGEFKEKLKGIMIASDLVRTISNQVNMLALNASIEAARAGEYGRGFSVVADNIRKLADETKLSVEKVTNIITDLTSSIDNGMDSLNTSVVNVTTVAEETASGAEEASAATEEQAATMEELSASAQELAKIANDLEEIINRFKI